MKRTIEDKTKYIFQLFVAGSRPSSIEAQANLERICEHHLKGHYELEIIDVLENYQAAIDNGIMLTPTLILVSPPPRVAVVGSLNDDQKVLNALNVPQS